MFPPDSTLAISQLLEKGGEAGKFKGTLQAGIIPFRPLASGTSLLNGFGALRAHGRDCTKSKAQMKISLPIKTGVSKLCCHICGVNHQINRLILPNAVAHVRTTWKGAGSKETPPRNPQWTSKELLRICREKGSTC